MNLACRILVYEYSRQVLALAEPIVSDESYRMRTEAHQVDHTLES
jgi:hypothetical protein